MLPFEAELVPVPKPATVPAVTKEPAITIPKGRHLDNTELLTDFPKAFPPAMQTAPNSNRQKPAPDHHQEGNNHRKRILQKEEKHLQLQKANSD